MDPETLRLTMTACAAVLGGLIGSTVTAFINRRNTVDTLKAARLAAEDQWMRTQEREHAVWMRDKKQEVYSDFLVEVDSLWTKLRRAPTLTKDTPLSTHEVSVKRGLMKIIGSREVRILGLKVEAALFTAIAAQDWMASNFKAHRDNEHEISRDDSLAAYNIAGHRVGVLLGDLVETMRSDLGTAVIGDELEVEEPLSPYMYPLETEATDAQMWFPHRMDKATQSRQI